MSPPRPRREMPSARRLLLLRLGLLCLGVLGGGARSAWAQAEPEVTRPVTLNLRFVPTDRAQIAVWLEREDGTFIKTLALTHAVARLGIGNRPGALQMNSGFRWPYGRREGVLPVWAHRRALAEGAKRWKRVIFQDRLSEGFASRNTNDQSVDDFYCLSFTESHSNQDALDAVTCASVFSSDKGRFLAESDSLYSEPYQLDDKMGIKRELSLDSLYPPRRDVERCSTRGCFDHADVATYKTHALEVMPELDAVTQATPQGQRSVAWNFVLKHSETPLSPESRYTLYIEVSVEGDYNDTYNDTRFPTPDLPQNSWDTWARTFGYPYRGQPSVVYALPFQVTEANSVDVAHPVGYGALHGENGELHPLDRGITNDPARRAGSGADRLRETNGKRASLEVLLCDKGEVPPEEAPGAVSQLRVTKHPDELHAHMWARLSFRTPQGTAPVQYEVRVRPSGGDWQQAFTQDTKEALNAVALDVCADPDNPVRNRCDDLAPNSELAVDLAGLRPDTAYSVSVTPRATDCGGFGEVAMASFRTPDRKFSTVSPCFVATAAYGSPLAAEISVLRRFRDRYLAPHALGRTAISAYYEVGPSLADYIRARPWARTLSRRLLDPVVALIAWWMT